MKKEVFKDVEASYVESVNEIKKKMLNTERHP